MNNLIGELWLLVIRVVNLRFINLLARLVKKFLQLRCPEAPSGGFDSRRLQEITIAGRRDSISELPPGSRWAEASGEAQGQGRSTCL